MRSLSIKRLASVALAAGCASFAVQAEGETPSGELRLSWTDRSASSRGPLAAAEALQPGIAPPPASALLAEAELRHMLRTRLGATPLSLAGNLWLGHQHAEGRASDGEARVNELHLSADFGAWQASAGKKVLGWDVGYGFRPNDFVQQEVRRTLLSSTPEGRPLLQLERFDADSALSLVWVNPQRWSADDAASRGAAESAFAWRAYRRFGGLDAFGFARHGAHTGASIGSALAWIATDELELHGSIRLLQRHDGWRFSPAAGDAPVAGNPWQPATLGHATQWLVGASWTGLQRQGVLLEYWHDGTTLADADWKRWNARSSALKRLPSPPVPAAAKAGNLAWQATPFNAQSLRRDNLFVRLSWQPEPWQLAFDALITPADRGRMLTASLQWQGDHWRLNAAVRINGGPAEAVIAQLPTRRSVLLAATRPF
ncbi:hypothetical protein HLB44_17750 [Aquincola sp. S2]|uniref:Beta-barrel porin-2, OmpL-like. bbp2 n=1 Tax=Pseudaquabacterium terrae TaxID=2732868 RepID=A0ABX2EJN7_9BURK|nr:hypothetical protein [Aquabacterium terrae]NRF68840.1 hypothetical protein [Aquabacterium terrae]